MRHMARRTLIAVAVAVVAAACSPSPSVDRTSAFGGATATSLLTVPNRSLLPPPAQPISTAPASPSSCPALGSTVSLPQAGGLGSVAAVVLTDGSFLLSEPVTATEPNSLGTVGTVLAKFGRSCQSDHSFGVDGSVPFDPNGQASEVDAMAATEDGGALLGGPAPGGWYVSRINGHGALVTAFGTDGYVVIPEPSGTPYAKPSAADAIVEAKNGDVLIGVTAGMGCCVLGWVAELDPLGHLVTSFGDKGMAPVPAGNDGGLGRLLIEPDGEILVVTQGGNMGCWYTYVEALTATGEQLPDFDSRFRSALDQISPRAAEYGFAFIGDIALRPGGFYWVGTTADGCVDPPQGPQPAAVGRMIAFNEDGRLDQSFGREGWTDFTSAFASVAWAVPESNGSPLLASWPLDSNPDRLSSSLDVVRLTSLGQIDAAYGLDGKSTLVAGPPQSVEGPYEPLVAARPEDAIAIFVNGDKAELVPVRGS